MSYTQFEIRRGAYYDSIVLMQLQSALAALPGVQDAGVVMGSEANKELLAQSGLLTDEADRAGPDDLLIVVRAGDPETGEAALREVDRLLVRRAAQEEGDYLPHSLDAAAQMLPGARWVLVSVPGRYAAGVARQALALGKNVFLYSDNVALADEVALKEEAARRGLLVMGPDCGTAIINGAGLGFANRVRRGAIGLVAASGTGLQAVAAHIHGLGGGLTHALGTGGRDLSQEVGALTIRQGLELLRRDPETRVIVLISKPPAEEVAAEVLRQASRCEKPVVVNFVGYTPRVRQQGNLWFAGSFDEAAALAVELADPARGAPDDAAPTVPSVAGGPRYLRGLFSGGTLAYEALLLLSGSLSDIRSNVPFDERLRLPRVTESVGHTIVDLGADEFTVGRLHPMMEQTLRLRRLAQEADDPEVALILLDVVLGDGAHPDPASELAPAIAEAKARASQAGRTLEVVALVIGTDEDPQGLEHQIEQLTAVGAHVETSGSAAARTVAARLAPLQPADPSRSPLPPIELAVLHDPVQAINVGVEIFAQSLEAQAVPVLQVRWRPPASGNERLMAILARMSEPDR